MVLVVGVVVDGGHSAHLVEAFDEHALGVHVAEAHGADDARHALAASPYLDGLEQGVDDILVIDEVHPAEAHVLLAEFLVGGGVDDGGDAAYGHAVAVSHERLRAAVFESRVLVGHEGVDFVKHQRRHKTVVSGIEVDAELHVFPQLALQGSYGTYFYIGFFCQSVRVNLSFCF